jgi:hypothetical protein
MSIECAFFGALARNAERRTSKAGKPYLKFITLSLGTSPPAARRPRAADAVRFTAANRTPSLSLSNGRRQAD